MYVFVDIGVDVAHLVASVRANFRPGAALALAGTIQFASSIQASATAELPRHIWMRLSQGRCQHLFWRTSVFAQLYVCLLRPLYLKQIVLQYAPYSCSLSGVNVLRGIGNFRAEL